MKLQPKVNYAVYTGDSRHSHVTLRVNMTRLERGLPFDLHTSTDLNNLLLILRKNAEKAKMVRYLMSIVNVYKLNPAGF